MIFGEFVQAEPSSFLPPYPAATQCFPVLLIMTILAPNEGELGHAPNMCVCASKYIEAVELSVLTTCFMPLYEIVSSIK